ncbi:endolytic transglycosylase MltG [Kitasatospora sp. MBT63]|uniref:endolytic transglycosylase MltG n=1 Tax=Kitasatospora sp. MBT63 TaxID=1444768 RepID=UPI00068A7714|nr:endolytic transglycosylase MltG [Kitasatospora sp. MBT63]
MSDPFIAPGLTPGLSPGHLGAPVLEPEPRALLGGGEQPPPPDPRRRHTGLACLLTAVALVAVVAVVMATVYVMWPKGRPPAADYTGNGSGTVQVSVSQGASLTQIGQTLVKNDVVASARAFTEAAAKSPAGNRIQPGTYTLHHRMSAAAALNVLLDPGNANALTIPEGRRTTQIYAAVDSRLNLPAGTTESIAKQRAGELGLPPDAHGNPEGYLYPSTYPITGDTTPLGLLQEMVKEAGKAAEANGVVGVEGQSAYQMMIVASLAEAEADNPDDMAKVARVIYNRLAKGMPLQLDSTINYALGRSTLTTTATDTKLDSPYNTYLHKGLPPGPIGNPGRDGLHAATHPAEGDWIFFVTVSPGDTRFTDSPEQHQKNVDEFNAYRAEHPASPAPASP